MYTVSFQCLSSLSVKREAELRASSGELCADSHFRGSGCIVLRLGETKGKNENITTGLVVLQILVLIPNLPGTIYFS